MTDGRNFEWPSYAIDTAEQMVFRYATVQEVMQALIPYVKDALAAEYDRGYETALDMEIQPEKSVAWERGFAAGAKHERSLWQWQAGGISRAVNGLEVRPEPPVNPYSV